MTKTEKKEAIHFQFEGEVVSVKENKTIHVLVKTTKLHEKYKKQYVTSRKYAVHDEKNEAQLGDIVLFQECRPISKTKKWRLIKILKKAVK
ncbi:MAG TPA: 30S ribosomal protein S17 [Candidatus Magasanikbacteria bacterium]|jgi:small subunit ribosomal protein S17|nr:30S ribosomal protein S17 [Candidatus Magasanikbacteria bacterium]HQF57092.1 30S ribosomal protein S17 [Candidatus Magasanikbacteria bacterium]HQL52870.1 30S ribosomal protein S17 [Candidatus Magasanikbacteria bacterium]